MSSRAPRQTEGFWFASCLFVCLFVCQCFCSLPAGLIAVCANFWHQQNGRCALAFMCFVYQCVCVCVGMYVFLFFVCVPPLLSLSWLFFAHRLFLLCGNLDFSFRRKLGTHA